MLIARKFREYLLPTMVVTAAMAAAMVVDGIFAGNFLGEKALSAINLSVPVIFCMNTLVILFIAGGVIQSVIAKGRREDEKASKMFTLAILAGLGGILLFSALLIVFMQPLTLALTQGNEELALMATRYLSPYVFVAPVILLFNISIFVRADGNPKAFARIALTACLVKPVFGYIFFGYLGFGLEGAALSSAVGYGCGILVMTRSYFFSKQRTLRFIRLRKQDFSFLKPVFLCGLPKALNQMLSLARTIVLNILILSAIGVEGAAAMAVCLMAFVMTSTFIMGTNDTLIPIVGTLFGERDFKGVRYAMRSSLTVLSFTTIAFMILFLLFPIEVGLIFGVRSAHGCATLAQALRLYSLCLPFFCVNFTFQNFFQTTGREKTASIIAALNGFVFIALFALIISRVDGTLIWLAFMFSEAATLIFIVLYGRAVRKKENVCGSLLLPKDDDGQALWEVSIPATEEAAVGVSKNIIDFCINNNIGTTSAARLGLAVEEMVISTINYAHPKKEGNLDICLRCTDELLIVRFRDDGIPFDPTIYKAGVDKPVVAESVEVLNKISQDIKYSWQLGFNSTIITIPRQRL